MVWLVGAGPYLGEAVLRKRKIDGSLGEFAGEATAHVLWSHAIDKLQHGRIVKGTKADEADQGIGRIARVRGVQAKRASGKTLAALLYFGSHPGTVDQSVIKQEATHPSIAEKVQQSVERLL